MGHELAVPKLTREGLCLVEVVLPSPVETIPLPKTRILISVDEAKTAIAVFEVILILTLVDISRCIFINPSAMLQPSRKLALIGIAIAVAIYAKSMFFIVAPVSLVVTTIHELISPLAVECVVLPLAFVKLVPYLS